MIPGLERSPGEGNGILAWRIPWTEGPGGLQSIGSQRVIAAISAFYAMSNRLAHFVNLVPNKEFYLMGRTNDVKDIRSEPAAPEI